MTEGPIEEGVQEVVLDSWQEFFSLADKRFSRAPAYIYRGQSNFDWPLLSSLDRLRKRYPRRKNLCGSNPEFFDCHPLQPDGHLKAFKHAIRGRMESLCSPLTDEEYWALGQHHGLATPLLDWTRSPWVALFFAFEQEGCFLGDSNWGKPESRGVYAFGTSTLGDSDENLPRIVSSISNSNTRLVNQAGVLVHVPSDTCLETYVRKTYPSENFPNSTKRFPVLMKIRIPSDSRDECLVALKKMNINYMTLFPDIDGAAKHVNSMWAPGHDDSIADF